MGFKLINRTKFKSKQLKEIASALLEGQLAPNFYLICEDESVDGISLTNLDKPTIIIIIKDLTQFAKTFVHELCHVQQHSKNYANEIEAEEREIIITDKNNKIG